MTVNPTTRRYNNEPQIRVKTYATYKLMLLDAYPSTFNLVLNDGKRTGFYVRTNHTCYKIGSLQSAAMTPSLASSGLSQPGDENTQILINWADIGDRPTASPTQIDDAVLSPKVVDSQYIKNIMNIQPPDVLTLEAQNWYIVDGGSDTYKFKLPADQDNLTSIKISTTDIDVEIQPHDGGTINNSYDFATISGGSIELVFNSFNNNWILVNN